MIKYITALGDRLSNVKAKVYRDQVFKPALKGMSCRKCSSRATEIECYMAPIIIACCSEFEKKIKEKLGIRV